MTGRRKAMMMGNGNEQRQTVTAGGIAVTLTHPGKVFYPADGITKAGLAGPRACPAAARQARGLTPPPAAPTRANIRRAVVPA